MIDYGRERVVVDEKGEISDTQYKGVFEVKTMLSHADHLEQDRIRRQLLGPEEARPTARTIYASEMFSQLAVRVITAPSWWNEASKDGIPGLLIPDDEVLSKIYLGAMSHDKAHKKELARIAKEEAEKLRKEAEESAVPPAKA